MPEKGSSIASQHTTDISDTKIAVIELSEDIDSTEKKDKDELTFETIGQIWRNAIILGGVILVLFTAFSPLQDLQSSLFKDEGMGTTVLAVLYISRLVSAFFLSAPMINLLGCKWTLVASAMCYIMYMAAHFYASWELFIPAAVVIGMGSSPLWGAKSRYLNTLAADYSKKKGVTSAAAASLFFGVFYFFKQSSYILGNVVSSLVLTHPDANSSITILSAKELSLCGKGFCPRVEYVNNTNIERPRQGELYMLAGIYTGCACLAVIFAVTLLQQLPVERNQKRCDCSKASCKPQLLVATFLHMKDYRQLLLIPITVYSGLEQAFFSGDFTQAFITCPLGNWWIGYILICFGSVDAVCSLLFGKLVQYVGRPPLLIFGAAINCTLLIVFLNFQIIQNRIYLYFIFAALWGMADSVWRTQIEAFHGVVFRENIDAAYSNSIMWKALGYIIAFAYQSHFCLPAKVYILLAVLGLGMAGYLIVEYVEWNKSRDVYSLK